MLKKGIKEVSKAVETKELKLLKVQALQEKARRVVLSGLDLRTGVDLEHFLGFVENFPQLYAGITALSRYIVRVQPDGTELSHKNNCLSDKIKSFVTTAVAISTKQSEAWVERDMQYKKGVVSRVLEYYVWVQRAISFEYCIQEYQLREFEASAVVYDDSKTLYLYGGGLFMVDHKVGTVYVYTAGKKHMHRVDSVEVRDGRICCNGNNINIYRMKSLMLWEERGNPLKNGGKGYKSIGVSTKQSDPYGVAFYMRLHHMVMLKRVGFSGILVCRGLGGLFTVDHISMHHDDNRLENLRLLTRVDNKILGEELSKDSGYSTRYVDFDRYFGAEERFSRVSQKELAYEVAMSRLLESIS